MWIPRQGDTLVVSKLDRLARSVPDARAIADQLAAKGVRLALGAVVHDPTDPMGKIFFNILATFAEFEADLNHLPLHGVSGKLCPAAAMGPSSDSGSRGGTLA